MDTVLPLKQVSAVLNLFGEKGMTRERMTEILKSGILADLCDESADFGNRRAVQLALGLMVDLEQPFTLTINYELLRSKLRDSVRARISQSRFYWITPDAANPDNCPIVGEGIECVEAKVFRFDMSHSLDEIFQGIQTADASRPWKPARFEHLLALGKWKYQDEEELNGITALGSMWMGPWFLTDPKKHPCYPCTTMIGSKEGLGISFHNQEFNRWKYHGRYLAFRPLTEQV